MRVTHARAVVMRSIVDLGVFSFVINVLLLAVPIYLLQVYDRVLPSSSLDTLIFLSIIAVLALVFMGFFEIVRSFYAQRLAGRIDKQWGSNAFAQSFVGAQAETGDIQSLRDLSVVRSFVGSRGLTTLFDLPFAPLFIAVLYFIHPGLFWLTIAGAAVLILLVVLNQFVAGKSMSEAAEQSAMANLAAQAFSRNADTLRAMGMKHNVTEVWGNLFAGSLEMQGRSASINSVFSGISRATRMMLQLAILGVGAWFVLIGEMTAGMIFAASLISGRALQPLDQLIGGWRQTSEARRAWKRLKTTLPTRRDQEQKKLRLPAPTGRLSVRDLVYVAPGSQPGSKPILARLNFEIDAGESVAIVGPSRAGKSTLARLLVGAIEPSSGVVQFDGADLKTWDETQIGKEIGYLAQDVQLLPGTIADNISRFDPGAKDESVVAAAQAAQVHELILSQRDGYQTRIGKSNGALSGGERQRVGLARAFYGAPKVLVLDEPNANLDIDGETALAKALANAHEIGTTVIIVTHRMSIAASCDRTLMLRDGVALAFGPSAEVLQQLSGAKRGSARGAPPSSLNTDIATFSTSTQTGAKWTRSTKAKGNKDGA